MSKLAPSVFVRLLGELLLKNTIVSAPGRTLRKVFVPAAVVVKLALFPEVDAQVEPWVPDQ